MSKLCTVSEKENLKLSFSSNTNESKSFVVDGGDTSGALFVSMSPDPYTPGAEIFANVDIPIKSILEFSATLSRSQALATSEFGIEVVPLVADNPIKNRNLPASISVTSNVATITFATPHNFKPVDRVILYGCTDNRINVGPVLPTIVNSVTITIPLTIANGSYNSTGGIIEVDDYLSNCPEGMGFNIASSLTAADVVIKRKSNNNINNVRVQSLTIPTLTATQASTQPNTQAFISGSKLNMLATGDSISAISKAPDSTAANTAFLSFTQNILSNKFAYNLRFRSANLKNITYPIARILSATKTASAIATIVTRAPHGLITGDWIQTYGIRDITNFPSLVAAAQVTVVNPTTFTVTIGTSATATSLDGLVFKVQGQALMYGVQNLSVQSLQRTNNELTITMNTTAAGALNGEYWELGGCNAAVAGLSIPAFGLEGTYKILRMTGSTYVVESIGPDFAIVNTCGGCFFKRVENRVHYADLFEKDVNISEIGMIATGILDLQKATPVNIANAPNITTLTTLSTLTNVTNSGTPTAPATPYFLNSAATTNGNLVLTGTSGLQAFHATNIGATAAFVKLYNKATAPTVGTDVPEMIIPVPAAAGGIPGVAQLNIGHSGHRFPLGLGIAITGAVADTDTTAVAAGQVKVKLSRTI